MTRVYLFSGLGADERLFGKIGNIDGYELIALPYVGPGSCTTMADYARLLTGHFSFEAPYLFGGVSIGGMISQELAQITKPKGLILISTAKSRSEMPLLFSFARKIPTKAYLKKPFLEAFAKILDPFTIKSAEGRQLFLDMLHDTDPDFLSFGAKAILNWEPPKTAVPFIRIHGTRDRVFPAAKIEDAAMIEEGNHFMAYERGGEVTGIIKERLKQQIL